MKVLPVDAIEAVLREAVQRTPALIRVVEDTIAQLNRHVAVTDIEDDCSITLVSGKFVRIQRGESAITVSADMVLHATALIAQGRRGQDQDPEAPFQALLDKASDGEVVDLAYNALDQLADLAGGVPRGLVYAPLVTLREALHRFDSYLPKGEG